MSLPKNDFILCEHGMSLKLNSLRLGDTVLIISKTKPAMDGNIMVQYLSIGLLSLKF